MFPETSTQYGRLAFQGKRVRAAHAATGWVEIGRVAHINGGEVLVKFPRGASLWMPAANVTPI